MILSTSDIDNIDTNGKERSGASCSGAEQARNGGEVHSPARHDGSARRRSRSTDRPGETFVPVACFPKNRSKDSGGNLKLPSLMEGCAHVRVHA